MKKCLMTCLLLIMLIAIIGCNENTETSYKYDLFNNDLALVCIKRSYTADKSQYGYINKKGELVFDKIFETAFPFNNGYAIVQYEENYYLINTEGEFVTEGYRYIQYNYENNLYIATDKTKEKEYLIDSSLSILCEYKLIDFFEEGLSCVTINENEKGYINPKGKLVFKCNYKRLESFSNGFAKCVNENDENVLLNKEFKVVYNAYSNEIMKAYDNIVYVRDNSTYQINVYDYNNNLIREDVSNIFGSFFSVTKLNIMVNYKPTVAYKAMHLFNGKVIEQFDEYIIGKDSLLVIQDSDIIIYDDEFEIIEKINNDSGYYTEISSDLFSEKYYIQLIKDGEIINFIFDLKNNTIERANYLNEFGLIDEIFNDYIVFESDYEYCVTTKKGKKVIDFDVYENYFITISNDGYFILGNNDWIILDEDKKVILPETDYDYIYVNDNGSW